ncbi:MAG: HAMP domain-containing histidine kinase [Sphingobacteriales bacterium]|nr:MAG: HAMP domain-containing histidine kinase [Sphingobacteriales bacterium]
MNKMKIRLVIGLMGIAVIGLILIQIYWITKAIEVNKEIFSRHVNDALQNVALKLERKDAFSFISMKSLKDTSIIPDVGVKSLSPSALKPYLLRDLRRMKYADYTVTDVPIDFTDEPKHSRRAAQNLPQPLGPEFADTFVTQMEFEEIESISQLQSPEEVNKILKKKYLLEKLAVDLARRTNPLQQRLDFYQLDKLLVNELRNRNIELDYEFGVFQENSKRFLFTSDKAEPQKLENSVYQSQLFPNDFFLEPNFIKLQFPKENVYILQKMSSILGSSLVFIVIIILTFMWMMRRFLEQKKLSEMKTDFINNMTHEFKTPITTIALASEALRDTDVQKSENRVNRLAEVIQEENHRLEGQVERVLQIARLQKGELQLDKEPINIHEIIEKAISQVSLIIDEKHGQLNCNLAAKNAVIKGDKVHLTNIIYNLLDNAIKYSKDNPEISINSYNKDAQIVIEITDNGIGISQEAQKRIFEQFYRVPTGNVHNVKGFGLGLSYVKTMLLAHDGNIQVKSASGKGSTFTFSLPIVNNEIVH